MLLSMSSVSSSSSLSPHRHWWILVWLFLLHVTCCCHATGSSHPAEGVDDSDNIDPSFQKLLDWVVANEGRISSKIQFQSPPNIAEENDQDGSSSSLYQTTTTSTVPIMGGFVAKVDIAASEILIRIPPACVFRPSPPPDDRPWEDEIDMACATTRALLRSYQQSSEASAAAASSESESSSPFFQPYLEYMLHRTPKLPDLFSDDARAILNRMTGEELPSPLRDRSFINRCLKDDVEEEMTIDGAIQEQFFAWVMAKSWNEALIPLFDLIPHRNGRWTNVDATWATQKVDEDILVYSTRNIAAGERLYTSYDQCRACNDNLRLEYGTNELLADGGTVEPYPQKWIWDTFSDFFDDTMHLVFELDYFVDEDNDEECTSDSASSDTCTSTSTQPATGQFRGEWINARILVDEDKKRILKGVPDQHVLHMMRGHWKALRNDKDYVWAATEALECKQERRVIRQYYESLERALKYAIWTTYDDVLENTVRGTNDDRYYDSFEPRPALMNPSSFIYSTCHPSNHVGRLPYERIYSTKTPYQRFVFKHGIDEDDTCLWIEDIAHACQSYRVLHESLIHYPASFLPEMKRVVYVGGGDSMILHEVLKYPSIELVVGLELDQHIVRSSFRFFGTRPYFDDPRVEWWFGDATKSLKALPEDYFGSFDLVIVDLTNDIADTFYVTPQITLMDAMTMLLKQPNGILTKQEDYTDRKGTDFNRYTLDLEYLDLAHICRQSFTIGSNGIDFLSGPQYDHNISRIYLHESLDKETRYKDWYNYRDNHKSLPPNSSKPKVTCDHESHIPESLPSNETQLVDGILMVIEAEELSGSITSKDDLVDAITKALAKHDIKVETVDYSSSGVEIVDSSKDIVLFFKEGYAVVRQRLAEVTNYLGIDLHLWTGIEKMKSLKADILQNVGGDENKATSYRIVTGGIVQGSNGQNPSRGLGACKTSHTDTKLDSSVGLDDVNEKSEVLADAGSNVLVGLIPAETISIVVLCGSKEEACSSLDALQSTVQTDVISVHTCPTSDSMLECESSIAAQIRESMSKRINGVWIDANATKTMASVLMRLLTSVDGRANILDEDAYVVVAELTAEEWREVFLQRFLLEISPACPSKLAQLSMPDGRRVGVFSAGNEAFYANLVQSVHQMGPQATINSVVNGHHRYHRDFSPRVYTNADFDTTESYAQWQSQTSVGMQFILQLHLVPPTIPLDIGVEALYLYDDSPWLGRWTEVRIVDVDKDSDTYEIISKRAQREHDVPRHLLRRLNRSNAKKKSLDINSRVIVHQDHDRWRQGFLESLPEESEDGFGKYKVWFQDSDRTVEEVTGIDLVPEQDDFDTSEDALPTLSTPLLQAAFRQSLMEYFEVTEAEEINLQENVHLTGIDDSEGCIITFFWTSGHALLIWNGQKNIVLNVFLEKEDTTAWETFAELLRDRIPLLSVSAMDEQPRGYGRIVNFASEVNKERSRNLLLWGSGIQSTAD